VPAFPTNHINYSHINSNGTTTIKPAPGWLHALTLNNPVATSVITIYDSLSGSGTVIGVITVPSGQGIVSLPYECSFNVGLTIVMATAASDITVSWE